MLSLFNKYKNLILLLIIVAFASIQVSVFADDEITDLEIMESTLEKSNEHAKTDYINDIEILGANIIKPEQILSKMTLKKGDLYDKDVMQQDLKTIYKMGFFTERMKAVPVKNSNGTISLKVILEENIPVTDFTVEGNTVVSTEEIMRYLLPLKGRPQNIASINSAMEKINEYYYSKGYILSKIDSIYDDPDGMLNLSITEGKINKIVITGNEKTKEFVIERNIMTEPGAVYNDQRTDIVNRYWRQTEDKGCHTHPDTLLRMGSPRTTGRHGRMAAMVRRSSISHTHKSRETGRQRFLQVIIYNRPKKHIKEW